jgi:hypothetical protein
LHNLAVAIETTSTTDDLRFRPDKTKTYSIKKEKKLPGWKGVQNGLLSHLARFPSWSIVD